jgi:hypothetical protein
MNKKYFDINSSDTFNSWDFNWFYPWDKPKINPEEYHITTKFHSLDHLTSRTHAIEINTVFEFKLNANPIQPK